MNWYDRIMPTVREIEPLLKESSLSISSLPGVKEIRVWGSYAENYKDKATPIREVDLIVKCYFDSGDLLAIEKGPMGPFSIPASELEEEGFNPQAVKFTKGLLKSCNFNADLWCLSSDEKMLHWGPVADTVDEWKELRKQAETKAEEKTGLCKKNIRKSNEENAKEWIGIYESTLRAFINKGPLGWYQTAFSETDNILESSIKI